MSFRFENHAMHLGRGALRTIADNRIKDFIEMVRDSTISVNAVMDGRYAFLGIKNL